MNVSSQTTMPALCRLTAFNAFLFVFLLTVCAFVGAVPVHNSDFGGSVQFDPSFAYYQNRSDESIASELAGTGYKTVLYVLTRDSAYRPALMKALRAEHLSVWLVTFMNGTYDTADLPEGWQKWQMVTRANLEGHPLKDGYFRLCLNNPDYRRWKKAQLRTLLRNQPFTGVQMVEPHWPEYPGITAPAYACFCPVCERLFRKQYPEDLGLPDILNPESPRSQKNNPVLWKHWLEFREHSLTDFLNDVVNGPDGVRHSAPKAKVCIWTLGLREPKGLERVREDSGENVAEIARQVRPDIYCIQTHWPDWVRADLKPDYVRGYLPFLQAIQLGRPGQSMMIQADTGSNAQNRRDWSWIHAFEKASHELGAASTTYYEHFVSGYIYTEPPKLLRVTRKGGLLTLHFNKRLDPKSASLVSSYHLAVGQVISAIADGSLVRLQTKGMPLQRSVELTVTDIQDDESLRLYHDRPALKLVRQSIVVLPANKTSTAFLTTQ